MGNFIKRVITPLIATLCCACTISGCSYGEIDELASIDNISSGETPQSTLIQNNDTLPSEVERAQFNPDLLKRMTECVNSSVNPADAQVISQNCFMSYNKHLSKIFYARSVGELTIEASVDENNLAHVALSAGGVRLGEFEAYPAPEIMQVKIVSFEETPELARLGSQTIYQAAEAVLNQ